MKRPVSLKLALVNLLFFLAMVVSARLILPKLSDCFVLSFAGHMGQIETALLLLILSLLVVVPILTLFLTLLDFARGFVRQALLAGATSLALLLTPAVWLMFAESFASREEIRVNRAWGEVLDPMDAFTARYPDTGFSESALRLEAAAARLGVEMNPNSEKGAHPSKSDHDAYEAVRKGLSAFVTSQVDKANEALDMPPPQISEWLSSHDAEVLALVSAVLRGGPIILETDWTARESPLPSLAGLRGVQNALILNALAMEHAGDSHAATEALEASWRIGGALRDRGEVLSQLLAIALDRTTLGALRKVREVSPSWQERIAAHDYRMSLLRALEGEAWERSTIGKGFVPSNRTRPFAVASLWALAETPYMRLMAYDTSEVIRRMVVELKATNSCSLNDVPADWRIADSVAWWNWLGRIGVRSLVHAWPSAVRMALEVELTQKVLVARTLKAETGVWPAELSDLESTVCRDAKWKYVATQSGGVSITFGGNDGLDKPLGFSSKGAVPSPP